LAIEGTTFERAIHVILHVSLPDVKMGEVEAGVGNMCGWLLPAR
jgi:hypothetical protein